MEALKALPGGEPATASCYDALARAAEQRGDASLAVRVPASAAALGSGLGVARGGSRAPLQAWLVNEKETRAKEW